MLELTPTNKDLFFSKNDNKDLRLGDTALSLSPQETLEKAAGFSLLGYPDDEGIKLNGGRIGAAKGPESIRKYFYKMTPLLKSKEPVKLYDLGSINTSLTLKDRHEEVIKLQKSLLEKNHRTIGLGGGHDYGYPDGAAFLESFLKQKEKPLVINFDAHLDVRPLEKGISSGTPFFRLLENYSDFDFAEIGIQDQCNSRSHYEWCANKGAKILCYDDIIQSGDSLETACSKFLGDWLLKPRPTFISIDIDAFASCYAMGCSQSWPTGFNPESFMRLLQILIQRLDIKSLGIYEVSPPLDSDDRTSKLAAQLVYYYIFNQHLKEKANG